MEDGASGQIRGRIGVLSAFNPYGANVLAEKNQAMN
jgi:hypothetical protein